MSRLLILLAFCLVELSYSQTVNFQWAKQMGGMLEDRGNSIIVNSLGDVYSTGTFNGISDFDPGIGVSSFTSAGFTDIFISKLDAAGNFIWAKQIGGPSLDKPHSMTLDLSGNVYITGYFFSTVDFDPGIGTFTCSSVGAEDMFILKLDPLGNFVWAKQIGGSQGNGGTSISVDNAGNVYTTGYFYGTVDFDPGFGISNLTPIGGDDVFILKLDNLGNFIWVKQLGGSSYESGVTVILDNSGNVYTSGTFMGTVDFDPGIATFTLSASVTGFSVFISKLDPSGNFIWAKQMGEYGGPMTTDSSGNIYLGGTFSSTSDFDPGPGVFNMTSLSNKDGFLSKLDASGNFVWAKQLASSFAVSCNSIFLDGSGGVYTAGSFTGTTDFDPGSANYSLTSFAGYGDMFISKIDVAGNFNWVIQIGGNQDDGLNSMILDNIGNIYTTGFFGGPTDFDPNSTTSILTPFYGDDIFVHKFSPGSLSIGETFSQGKFSVSPNPNNGMITIFFKQKTEIKRIRLFNMLDQTFSVNPIEMSNSYVIDISDKDPGVYFLELNFNDEILTTKIIKN